MPIKYKEENCIKEIAEIYECGDLNGLYAEDFLNRAGNVLDGEKEYQEVYAKYISDWLIDGRLPMISLCNVRKYCTEERKDKLAENQHEEHVQRDFYYKRRTLDKKFGEPVWFELQTTGHGKGKGIDLVYYDKNKSEINIFELKYNSKETLLRAVLEIQTYYQRVDWYEAVKALKERGLINTDYISKINKYVLYNSACENISKKYETLTKDSYVKKLIEEFNIGIISYD